MKNKVTASDREFAFKGVSGSDKYGKLQKDSSSDDDDPPAATDNMEQEVEPNSKVVWYWMDHHAKVYCQWFWENRFC